MTTSWRSSRRTGSSVRSPVGQSLDGLDHMGESYGCARQFSLRRRPERLTDISKRDISECVQPMISNRTYPNRKRGARPNTSERDNRLQLLRMIVQIHEKNSLIIHLLSRQTKGRQKNYAPPIRRLGLLASFRSGVTFDFISRLSNSFSGLRLGVAFATCMCVWPALFLGMVLLTSHKIQESLRKELCSRKK